MIKAYHIEKKKWLCTFLKRHLASNENDASIFLNEVFLDEYIKKIGLNPINFKKIRCDYKGDVYDK